jgi:hypothetical protein
MGTHNYFYRRPGRRGADFSLILRKKPIRLKPKAKMCHNSAHLGMPLLAKV